jgi:hypothetical protein
MLLLGCFKSNTGIICEENCMARKTTGTGTTRGKKTTTPPAEVAPLHTTPLQVPESRRNVTPISVVGKKPAVDLDEEIRHRAYELFLERQGAAGDPANDWITAEREVRARHAGPNHNAFAAAQGRS